MDYNKEVFETEADYTFMVTFCAVLKIIMTNQPCTFSEIMFLAKYFMPDEMFEFAKEDIEYTLAIAKGLREVKNKHNVFIITDTGIDEHYMILEDINDEHTSIINAIEEVNYEFEPTDDVFKPKKFKIE